MRKTLVSQYWSIPVPISASMSQTPLLYNLHKWNMIAQLPSVLAKAHNMLEVVRVAVAGGVAVG